MIELRDKTILVTGASSGIGRACAIKASMAGAKVVLIGRSKERLIETYNNLEGIGHLYHQIDVTDYKKLESVIDESVAKIGPFSGFIHSAGIELTKPLSMMSPELYEKIFATNVISAFEISKLLSKNKNVNPLGASFVFISSIMALHGQKGKVGYCASKSALIGGTKSMALELTVKKIRVNCILPGVVQTEMTNNMFSNLPESSVIEIHKKHPLGIGKPEDVANCALFLLSDLSKWITGIDLIVDGGYHIE